MYGWRGESHTLSHPGKVSSDQRYGILIKLVLQVAITH